MTTVIYARISQDRTGEQAGVDRQLDDCWKKVDELGVPHDQVIVLIDNDLSATSGVVRPDFEKIFDVRPLTRIITWHQDRLLRKTRDLERVIELNVPILTITAGSMDLATPAGRAVARTVAAWSQYEGEQKAIRQKAANLQRAHAGKASWSSRPYGYDRLDGQVVIVEAEAAIIREAYARYLNDESYNSIARDFNRRGVPTARNTTWQQTTLRECLRKPRYAGINVYMGEVVGDGDWPPIIDRETWRQYELTLAQRAAGHGRGNKVQHLLSGLAMCGVCGSPLRVHRNAKTDKSSYVCKAGSCVSRLKVDLEEYVQNEIVAHLLTRTSAILGDEESTALRTVIDEDELTRSGIAQLVTKKLLTLEDAEEQLEELAARLNANKRRLLALEGDDPFRGIDDLAVSFVTSSMLEKRKVLRRFAHITVNKQSQPHRFEPESIAIAWLD